MMDRHGSSGLQEPAAKCDAGSGASGSEPFEDAILRLWRDGCDTNDIARRLNCSEAQIANRLAQLRDALARTPTQQRLFEERRARLARLSAAARPSPPDPVIHRLHGAAKPQPGKWSLPQASVPLDIRNVQEATCRHFGISLADLLSPRRCARFVRPRHVAVYLVRELTKLTTAQIGSCFGGRDHSTIVLAHRKIAKILPKAPLLQEAVRVIIADSAVAPPRDTVGISNPVPAEE